MDFYYEGLWRGGGVHVGTTGQLRLHDIPGCLIHLCGYSCNFYHGTCVMFIKGPVYISLYLPPEVARSK